MPEFLYIHIPFCVRKCLYCDFFSVPYNESLSRIYTEALCRELILKKDLSSTLKTMYIGGGTPSLLPDDCFQQLFACLKNNYQLSSSLEITVEANPGTINESKIDTLLSLGVNRLSIGVQSFDDRELRTLGRIHDSADVVKSIELIKKAGMINYSIDLMYGIPGQTMDSWKESLSHAVAFSPAHISAYELTVEENTPLFEMINSAHTPSPLPSPSRGEGYIISTPLRGEDNGEGVILPITHNRISTQPSLTKNGKKGFSATLIKPDEEIILEMYNHAIDYLAENAYEHYEISNFSRPGFRCMHNLNYWDRGEYVGTGAGAHSFVNNLRASNIRDIHQYIENLNRGIIPEFESIRPNPEEAVKEFIFLGLRKTEGVNVTREDSWRKNLLRASKELIDDGYLEIRKDYLRLTRKGIVISNAIIVKLFEKLEL